MKKLFTLIVVLIGFSTIASAQILLDARSMQIYYGQPKKVTQETPQGVTMTCYFDTQGRVSSLEDGNGAVMTFTWRPDNSRISVRTTMNGSVVGAGYINISKYNDEAISYEAEGTEIDIEFDSQKRMEWMGVYQGGVTAEMEYVYTEGSNSIIPEYMELYNNGNYVGFQTISDVKYDSKGNFIQTTINQNGYEQVNKRRIYYY
ncbi:MAG: hypothetical protein J6C56_05895 [Alistipes sp.]|nr:hypothetical protein [Alistipes sp.]